MNLLIQPNQICLIVKLYNNRPELLPDSNDLLEEKEHTPGIIKDYFYLEEYKFLEERVLEIVRELKPEMKDQLV